MSVESVASAVAPPAADEAVPGGGRRTLTLLVAASALFHLLLLLLPRALRWDEPAYLLIGRELWAGRGFTWTGSPELHYPPLFPMLFGGTWKLTGNPEIATDVWFVVAGALLVLPVYALAARAFDRRVAVSAALLAAVFPGLTTSVLYWGTMTEPVFALLVLSAAWLAQLAVERDDWRRALAAGVLVGIAYLGRPEGVGWLAALALATAAVRFLDRRLGTRRAWAGLAALGLGFALLALPYVAYLHRHTGRWMLSGKLGITYEIGAAVLAGDAARYDEITNSLDPASGEVRWESGQRFEETPSGVLVEDRGSLATRVGRNLARLGSRAATQPVFPLFLGVPLFVAWLAASRRRERWRAEAWIWATVLPVAAFVAYHIQQRFFAPAFPGLLVWVAAGLLLLGAGLERRRPGTGRRATRWLLVATLAGLGVAHVAVLRRELPTVRDGHREAGRWIGENAPPDARVLAVELAVCAYAARGCLPSPRAPLPQLLDYARRHGGTYLTVDEAETREARPFLLPLLDPAHPPPGLEPVFVTADAAGRTIVYRIDG